MAGPTTRFILGNVIRAATNNLRGFARVSAENGIRREISLAFMQGIATQLRARNRVRDQMMEPQEGDGSCEGSVGEGAMNDQDDVDDLF